MILKNTIRELLVFFHIDITKNLQYDRRTKAIINKAIKTNSVCIDIGCHKGEILDLILKKSPDGTHFGFEPIPDFFNKLLQKYKKNIKILPYALSDKEGITIFQYVKNAPAYSGIKRRDYAIENPDIEEISVKIKKLDDVIDPSFKIDFIKIDVEGAEMGVLNGSKRIISTDKPIVIFEFGLGASNYYETEPRDIFNFFANCEMQIFTLKSWLKQKNPLTLAELENLYKTGKEYYFIANKN
jgi:FkbM family methyltransferase